MTRERWTPPPPGAMPESRARMALGTRFALWQQLGQLLDGNDDVRWAHLWKAATDLIEEGHAPRDRKILERARQYAREEADYWRDTEQRRAERRRRRTNGGQPTPDQSGPAD